MRKLCGTLLVSLMLTVGSGVRAGLLEDGIAASERGDFETALRLFRSAAEQGDAAAQNNLGFMYESGRGVAQDYQEAVKWYRLAAEQGNAIAQSNLGVVYSEGKGVAQDYREAVKWYPASC
jgi:TPR repeat protein